jgi:hypothetical protein
VPTVWVAGMAQTAKQGPWPVTCTLEGMTARWFDPHRLPSPTAYCDPGYARAVSEPDGR